MTDIVATDDVLDHILAFELPGGATLFDELPNNAQQVTDFVLVGDDGDPDAAETEAGSSTLARASFEEPTRDEIGDVVLAVFSQSGRSDPGDLKACRDASKATFGEVRTLLAADPTCGGAVADCWFSEVRTVQGRNAKGAFVRRVVTLSFEVLQ